MDREKVAQTMDDVIRSYRKQLAENDDSVLSNIGNSMKMGFESFRGSFSGTEADKLAISTFKHYADTFEDELKKHNRASAEKALADLEQSARAFRVTSAAVN